MRRNDNYFEEKKVYKFSTEILLSITFYENIKNITYSNTGTETISGSNLLEVKQKSLNWRSVQCK